MPVSRSEAYTPLSVAMVKEIFRSVWVMAAPGASVCQLVLLGSTPGTQSESECRRNVQVLDELADSRHVSEKRRNPD